MSRAYDTQSADDLDGTKSLPGVCADQGENFLSVEIAVAASRPSRKILNVELPVAAARSQ